MRAFVFAVGCVAIALWAGSASADIVAEWDGPKTFASDSDMVTLPNVPISTVGRVDLQFEANNTSAAQKIWYMADSVGGTVGEYQIFMTSNEVGAEFWGPSGHSPMPDFHVPFSDTTSFHSLSLAWQQGSPTVLTLDGVAHDWTNSYALPTFTSACHDVGAYPGGNNWYFRGTVENVVVRNTYSLPTPEPGTLALLITGLIGLLCYAWRKRK